MILEKEIKCRYSIVEVKNKREIVLIRGSGCTWRRCRFCDYHLDFNKNQDENFILNKALLDQVTGIHKHLEIINSGSFVDLSDETMDYIEKTCIKNNINELYFECHFKHKAEIKKLKDRFIKHNIKVLVKIGVETFDYYFRESYLTKGITEKNPAVIANYFDEVCLLQGIPGQNVTSMTNDIETGLKYFHRVYINIMQENAKPIKPDPKVIKLFMDNIYPKYKDNPNVDILLDDEAFGVGGVTTYAKDTL
ncbi:MAG: radical SAM protein [bacterium]